MRTLHANLKLFCQYRALWLFYGIVAAIVPFGLWLRSHAVASGLSGIVPSAAVSANAPLGGLLIVSFIGLIVAVVQMDVVHRPFAFCLPGCRDVLRNLIFIVGLVATVILSLAWPGQDAPSDLLRLRFFCTGLVVYFISVHLGLIWRVAPTGIAFVPMLLFMSLLPLPDLAGRYVVLPPAIPVAALSIATAAALWFWLARTNLCRRYGGQPWLGLSGLNRIERDRYLKAVDSSKPSRLAAVPGDGCLLRFMKDREPSSAARDVLGILYTWSLPGGGSRQDMGSAAFFGIGSAIVAWLMPLGNASFLIFFGCMSMEAEGRDPSVPLLVAGGRWERFLTVMMLLAVRGGALALSLAIGFAMMGWIGPHLPWLHARTGATELGFVPMGLGFAVLLTAVVPFTRLLLTAFPARRKCPLITLAAFGCLVSIWFLVHGRGMAGIPLAHVFAVHLASWSLCACGIYRTMMRVDLVRG